MGRLRNICKHSAQIINDCLPNGKINASKVAELTLQKFNRETLTEEEVDEIIYQHIYKNIVILLNSRNYVAVGKNVYQDIETIDDKSVAEAIQDRYKKAKKSADRKLRKIRKIISIIDGQMEMVIKDNEIIGYREAQGQ